MELKRVTRIDSIPAGSTYFNEQGFLHDTPVVTSTGIFEYALPDGGVRRELRLPEHVFDKQSLASYSGKPVIITHDAGSIDKNNVMKEIVGTILTEGYQDGNDVRCKIVIHDIDKVKKTPYRELSLGYSLDLIEEPGVWEGEPYDAIQTNIRINHLAIVENARAGDQAHLNLDGKKIELDDKENQEGGNEVMQKTEMHGDSIDMTPEELLEAVKMYKASKGAAPVEGGTEPTEADGGTAVTEPVAPAEEPAAEKPAPEEPAAPTEPTPTAPEAEKQDGNEKVISMLEELLATLKGGAAPQEPAVADSADCGGAVSQEDNGDSSDDKSQSMNNDADDTIAQKLSICRTGDKLGMTGLETQSIMDGKKAIIGKVLPDMRLDGKSAEYINAAYDMAVCKVNERKGVDYQRQQMSGNTQQGRLDGTDNVSMAASARQRMLDREGGNE